MTAKSSPKFNFITHTDDTTLSSRRDNSNIDTVYEFNFLGFRFNKQLNWQRPIDQISSRCSRTIGILNKLKRFLSLNIKIVLCNALVLSHKLWPNCLGLYIELKNFQKAVRIICLSKYNGHTDPLSKRLKLLKVEHTLKILYHNFSHNKLPVYLQNLPVDQNNSIDNFNTRVQYNIHTIRVHHEFAKRNLRCSLPHTINNAPDLLKDKITTHSLCGFAMFI